MSLMVNISGLEDRGAYFANNWKLFHTQNLELGNFSEEYFTIENTSHPKDLLK